MNQPPSQTVGVETWRGSVMSWHIDQMGHMNIRFYVAIAMEALVGLAGALGMPRAFTVGAAATLAVRDLHVRYLKEARLGQGLHMRSAVLRMGQTDAEVLQVLFHSASDEPAAAITFRVEHVTAGEQRPFPWSASARSLAQGLTMAAPEFAVPRGLVERALEPPFDQGRADALALRHSATGALDPGDCDVFGLMRPEHLLARIGAAMPHQIHRANLPIERYMPELAGSLGAATVELRASFPHAPRAGERLMLRSGLVAVTPKTVRFAHWLLDPATGQAWAEGEMLIVNFDLQARKAVALAPELVKLLEGKMVGARPLSD